MKMYVFICMKDDYSHFLWGRRLFFPFFFLMMNFPRANLADKQIRQIEKELSANEAKIRMNIQKAELIESQFPEKQRKISELENQLKILQDTNRDPQMTVSELTKRKESLISQNHILKQFLREIQSRINENGDCPTTELSDSQKQQIIERLEVFFNNLEEEYQSFDIQSLLDELKRVKEQRKKIESEIDILRQVSGSWDPEDDIDIVVDNYSNYASSPDEKLNEYQYFHMPPLNMQEPQILETSVNNNDFTDYYNKTKESVTQLERKVEDIQEQNGRNRKIFNEQEQYLSTLEKLTNQYINNQSSSKHYETVSQAIDKVFETQKSDKTNSGDNTSEELKPLSIPDFTNYNEESIDPITTIADDFEKFSNELLQELPKTTLFEDVVRETEEKFIVPDYVTPKPKVEKVVTASKNLANLTKTLENMKELASIELPAVPEFKHENKSVLREVKEQSEITFPEIPEPNNENLNNLLQLVKQKLPEQLTNDLPASIEETITSNMGENDEEEEEEEIIEINPSKEIIDKVNDFHKTLEFLSNLELPSDPNLTRPQQVPEAIVRVENLDKNAILNSIEQFLSPNQQNAENIERECLILSKNIEKVKQKIAQLNEQETDLVSDDEVAIYESKYKLISKQYEELDSQVKENMQHLRDLRKECDEKKEEKAELQKQLDSIPMRNKTISELEEMVSKERERLAELRKQGNQEIEDYRKMMSRKK